MNKETVSVGVMKALAKTAKKAAYDAHGKASWNCCYQPKEPKCLSKKSEK